MVTNKLYLVDGKHYLIHGGDVYLAKGKNPLAWVNWNPGFVMFHGTVVGQNYKPKGGAIR